MPMVTEGITTEDLSIVARHKGVFTAPPELMPTRRMPDGPLLGNGDLGVAIDGVIERLKYYGMDGQSNTNIEQSMAPTDCPERHRFYLAKNDFWKTKTHYPNSHPCCIGGIDVNIPGLVKGDYHVEQVLETAEVVHTLSTTQEMQDPTPFTRVGATVKMRSWVAATENLLVIELTVDGEIPDNDPYARSNLVGLDVKLWPAVGNESEIAGGNLPDGYWATRRIATATESMAVDKAPCAWPSEAAVAMRLFRHREPGLSWFRMDGWDGDRFVISPSHTTFIVASVVTNHESEAPLEAARQRVADLDVEGIESLRSAHREWWRDFWSKSFIDIGDPLIEKYYYGSNYLMASCSRNKAFAPGIYGNWITADGPSWQGDYHLNYNHESPWCGVFSSNHAELADPYDTPILENLPNAKANAKEFLGKNGAYYDVGIGPRGLEVCTVADPEAVTEENYDRFLGQKSNGVFASSIMFMRFYHTYDLDYARRVYPFLIEIAEFWESYLSWETFDEAQGKVAVGKEGRYVITDDSLCENGIGEGDKNNLLSLGLVRMFFTGFIDMCTELGVDADRLPKWQHILDHLSEIPTRVADGMLRVCCAEEGPSSKGLHVVIPGMIWPSRLVGLGSEPWLLKIAQYEVDQRADHSWVNQFNGFNQAYPAAVRVGHNPEHILKMLREQLQVAGLPNLMIYGGGGGIENCSGVPAAINEMLLQTHAGVMRIFPVWPLERDARFGQLRTEGAFLVSSELKAGEIKGLLIESEKGRECVLLNPWPGRELQLCRDREAAEILSGEEVRFSTSAGESISIQPV
jgi:hypothetical protein